MMLSNVEPLLKKAWHPVALAAEVSHTPHRIWLLGDPWVLVQSATDEMPRAYRDRCPHRLAPLSTGQLMDDGTLQCGYHGWRFAVDGLCTFVPALGDDATLTQRARLEPATAVAIVAGIVWIAPEPPINVLPDTSCADVGFERGMIEPVATAGCAGAMIDNFLDVAHFPFVHRGTFATDESDRVDEYIVTRTATGFVAVTEHTFANLEDPGVNSGERPLLQRRRMTYDYTGPFTATLRLDYVEAGGTNLIVFAVQPESDGRCRLYTTIYRNDVAAEAMDAAIAFEERVLAEDLVIQHRMAPALPLDLTMEVHTKADRVTIELRRVLSEFLEQAR